MHSSSFIADEMQPSSRIFLPLQTIFNEFDVTLASRNNPKISPQKAVNGYTSEVFCIVPSNFFSPSYRMVKKSFRGHCFMSLSCYNKVSRDFCPLVEYFVWLPHSIKKNNYQPAGFSSN